MTEWVGLDWFGQTLIATSALLVFWVVVAVFGLAKLAVSHRRYRAARLSGGANPDATGAALALSLHHPVKERLMTLAQTKTTNGRWGLAAALLTGAALCAPLSVADPVKIDVENADARTIVVGDTVRLNLRSEHNIETGKSRS